MKRIYLAIAFAVFTVGIFAQTPNREGAAQFAQDFISHTDAFKTSALRKSVAGKGVLNTLQPNADLRTAYQTAAPKQTPLFVFQPADGEGFIMVAQTGDNYAVVGYSDKGGFDAGNIPLQLRAMMDFYEDSLRIMPTDAGAMNRASTLRAANATPLLDQKSIALNQFQHDEVGGSYTGCVATAYSQIMAYYQYPNRGIGSHCYNSARYGRLCADFGNTTYNWNNPTQADYKKLGFHVGVALDMNYGVLGSGTDGYEYAGRINEYFGYYVQRMPYLFADFKFLSSRIDAGQPIYVSLMGLPGHAVVLDGYDTNGFYHLNFGWGGVSNGYYAMGDAAPPIGVFASKNFDCVVITPDPPAPIVEQDSLALVDLYNSIQGNIYYMGLVGQIEFWDLSKPLASLPGVIIVDGRVVDISVSINTTLAQECRLPESLGNLTELRRLGITSVPYYPLILPQNIGQLTKLQILNIGSCTGEIPASLWQLTGLEGLFLTNGKLTVNIPASIGNLTQLKYLDLSRNQLSGSIPSAITNCIQLQSLILNNNQLSGEIPANIGNLTELRSLDLTYNQFSGDIPASFSKLTGLDGLRLSNNQFTGSIPASIGGFTNFTTIDLDHNQFSGKIPDWIGKLTDVEYLRLNDNQLSGEIPAGIGNCAPLKHLLLHNNQLSGAVPSDITSLKNLTSLTLDHNKLTTLPEGLELLSSLEELTLNNNQFTALPNSFGKLNLRNIDVSYNLLTTLPEQLFLKNAVTFNVSHNQIDTLPADLGYGMNKLKSFNISHNNIAELPANIRLIEFLEDFVGNNNRFTAFPDLNYNYYGTNPNYYENKRCALNSNYITGAIPLPLLKNAGIDVFSEYAYHLGDNYLTFEDIPVTADTLYKWISAQQPYPLNKRVVKAALGETLRLNVKELAPHFSLSSNQYYWKEYPKTYAADDRNDSILTIVVDENVIGKSYYCIVHNSDCPHYYSLQGWGASQSIRDEGPVLKEVVTGQVTIELLTEDDVFAEKYPNTTLLLSKNIPSGGMTNQTVTLVPPFETRGALAWQMSADGNTWVDASLSMTQQDLKTNIQSIAEKELVIRPKTPAFYRLKVTDEGCDPIYSDTLKINPYGNVIFDQVISVTDSTGYIVAVDSISISIPEAFYEGDFRLTIVKLAQAPGAGQIPDGEIGSIYDVTVSCGDVFDKPLDIMLKTNKVNRLTDTNIDNFSAVYFDNAKQEWVRFDDVHISLEDGCIYIETYHLTPIADHYFEGELYDRYFSVYDEFANPQEIRIYYKDKDETYFDLFYKKVNQPWNTGAEHPAMIYDVAHYLRQAIDSVAAHGLPYKHVAKIVSSVSGVFCVYIHYQETAQAYVDMCGKALGYIVMHREFDNPQFLAKTLAHEYMHYTQTPYTNSIFWGEAHAILTDKFVYDRSWLRQYEAEDYLLDGLTARKKEDNILEYLRTSWDYWDRFTNETKLGDFGNRAHCYQAGTFLHYMQSCRSGVKFDPAQFLKGSVSNTMGRSYLASYISSNLGSTIGDEYDGYLRYIMSGEDKRFTLLRRTTDDDGNPILSEHLLLQDLKLAAGKTSLTGSIFGEYYTDKFATLVNYNFKDFNPVKQTVEREIPYLASHIVILENNTPDKSVVVQYKRLYSANANHKVYYARFNAALKQYEYTDISDSLQYNILLSPSAVNSFDYDKANNDNSCFLLLVNKENPSWYQSGKWQASFELNAVPVPDLTAFDYFGVYDERNPSSRAVQMSDSRFPGCYIRMNRAAPYDNNPYNSSITYFNNFTATQSLKNDSVIVANLSRFEDKPYKITNDSEVKSGLSREITDTLTCTERATATIEYNFITGEMTITGNSKLEQKTVRVFGDWIDLRDYTVVGVADSPKQYNPWDSDTWTVKLKNIALTDFKGNSIFEYKTTSSSATQSVIESIVYERTIHTHIPVGSTGELEEEATHHFVGIDYSIGNVILNLWFYKR